MKEKYKASNVSVFNQTIFRMILESNVIMISQKLML